MYHHSGTVIGSDGFGFNIDNEGNQKKVSHNGNVVIEDNVEIGANCTIDRATLGSTILKKGVKIDNLIQIAHNVENWRKYSHSWMYGNCWVNFNWKKLYDWWSGWHRRPFENWG